MGVLTRLTQDPLVKTKAAAIEALKTNVMLADETLTITYMNPNLMALMQEAEAELKQELPRFNAATLIGSNIDVFHKQPAHQRKMLAAMTSMHSATIQLGKRSFDLVITPTFEAGKRTGFVVEWSDARPRLLNIDYASKMEAVSRTQVCAEFSPDGLIVEANALFLKTMGYALAEVQGKHHGMFVDPEYRNSAEYKGFWAKLLRGEVVSSQFKQIAKGGRVVWIDGAYNPIFDAAGKVVKIAKFATDVTAQADLLANLKTLIDQNFGEIDVALRRSEDEGQTATDAADATLGRVQTVTAGTEQLANSIGEISNNMARTQSAADHAFERAVAVGESTSKLAQATREMNGIVELIRNVAGQINLLALNATIEAARAGEAGKGFAVVASEVKNLASQSANATARISQEIKSIQATSSEVAHATETILDAIKNVREYVTSAASAVEQQNAVTGSMSAEMQSASKTVTSTTQSISGIAAAVSQVSQAVAKTKEAARVLVR